MAAISSSVTGFLVIFAPSLKADADSTQARLNARRWQRLHPGDLLLVRQPNYIVRLQMNALIPTGKDILPLVDALRPALLKVSRALRREAQRAGVSALDAQLLGAVKKNAGIGVSDLAEREQMTRASMSGHVKRMEAAGWIARSAPDDDDRRRVGLTLTAKGGKALDAIRRRRNDWLSAKLAKLSVEERAALAAAAAPRCAWPRIADGRRRPRQKRSRSAARSRGGARRLARGRAERRTAGAAEPEDKPFSSLVPAIIGAANLMMTLSATVIANALPSMAVTLRQSPISLNTTITVYLLALAIFLPVSGWAADRFGAKRVFLIAIGLYAASCAACGFANNLPELLLARFAEGAAGALMGPVGRLVLLRTTPKHDLVRAMSVLTMPSLLGPVIGPPIGGFIVTYLSWRWIFFLNIPIAIMGVILVTKYINDIKEEDAGKLDWVGMLLTGVGLAAVVYAFENLGRSSLPPWAAPSLLGGGLALLGVYAAYARRTPHAPRNTKPSSAMEIKMRSGFAVVSPPTMATPCCWANALIPL